MRIGSAAQARPEPDDAEVLPGVMRLSALAPLDRDDRAALAEAAMRPLLVLPRREMTQPLAGARRAVLLLDGWACRSVLLADGRRQITQFLLPGDLLLPRTAGDAGGAPTVTAVTRVAHCQVPMEGGLAQAIAVSRAVEEQTLHRHLVRLGRLSALERIADWLIELMERLEPAGLADGRRMPLPLTQELIGDALGLTSVHVNRTLQVLRREELLHLHGGTATFIDRARCAALVGRRR